MLMPRVKVLYPMRRINLQTMKMILFVCLLTPLTCNTQDMRSLCPLVAEIFGSDAFEEQFYPCTIEKRILLDFGRNRNLFKCQPIEYCDSLSVSPTPGLSLKDNLSGDHYLKIYDLVLGGDTITIGIIQPSSGAALISTFIKEGNIYQLDNHVRGSF